MFDLRRLALPLGSCLLISGCGSCPPCEAKTAKESVCRADEGEGTAQGASAPPATSAPVSVPPPAPAAAPTASAPPAVVDAPPPPGAALPEVKVENVGLHIGGGPNDDASKAPFLRALENQFGAFRSCYVKVDDPVKGGTFGVDLHIGRDGGHAAVKQPRTAMKGNGFRDCVVKVFEQVEFDKPKKGPTVISYSIKYTLTK